MGMIIGVDFASVDGNAEVDWEAARRWGVRFAIMRAAHGPTVDLTYWREAPRARAAGITVGAYGIIEWRAPIAESIKALASSVGKRQPGDLPVSVDVEFSGKLASLGIGAAAAIEYVQQYERGVREALGATMVYSSLDQWGDNLGGLDSAQLGARPLWLKTPYTYKARQAPHLVDERIGKLGALPTPWRRGPDPAAPRAGAWIQQFQGDAIGVPGFSATVDINAFEVYEDAPFAAGGDREPWVDHALGGVASVAQFQAARGLIADGVIGLATFAALCG